MTGDAVPGQPDFARLYAGPGSPLSPGIASRLWAAAVTLADTYDEGRWHLLKRSRPPIAQRLADEAEGATGDGSLATDVSLPGSPDRDEHFDAIGELHFRDHGSVEGLTLCSHTTIRNTSLDVHVDRPLGDLAAAAVGKWSTIRVASATWATVRRSPRRHGATMWPNATSNGPSARSSPRRPSITRTC